ncbi:MAG TPA: hypothetical protein DHV62_09840 [Elusimicrobia bacterium]|nr:hypothetical protein [Elusimicrobiota bacterium]
MNKEEAKKIIEILLTCDGGCEYCVSSLLKLFYKEFPKYKKLAEEVFRKQFNVELEKFTKRHSLQKTGEKLWTKIKN